MTELYPEGKRLWLSICKVRGDDLQRAETEWAQLETGCLIRGEWQRVAESFTPSVETTACRCETCRPITLTDMRMVLCSICGNKRCPRATDHRNICTNSNEPGQQGSSYGGMTKPTTVDADNASSASISGTSTVVPPVKQWQDIVHAVDLPVEDLAFIVDALVKRLGLHIVREQTPSYTSYELETIVGATKLGEQQ